MILKRHLLTFLALGLAFAVRAQTPLPDLMREADALWMIGSWVGETDNGETISHSFSWDMNQNLVLSHVKTPNWEAKGMVAVDPGTSQVQYFAVTTSGALIRGTWTEDNGRLLLKMNLQSLEGRDWKGAVAYQKADNDTMKLAMYRLNSAGDLETSSSGELTLKRKK